MKHVEALLVLLLHLLLLLLGTPVLDFQKWRELDTPDERAAARADWGLWADLAIVVAGVNGAVRQPLYDRVDFLQRPLRIRQAWHLYRDGPNRVRRMEVWVDGTLVHRSADDAYGWKDPQLRNRRLRPVIQAVTTGRDSPNWRGLLRWLVLEARLDFPQATEVRVSCTQARFPGTQAEEKHFYLARSPDWIARQDGRDP